jgi:hypothetical protein
LIGAAVGNNQSQLSDGKERIVPFPRLRVRRRAGPRRQPSIDHWEPDHSPVPDLAKYQALESEDDYAHRMLMNGIAFAFAALLVLAGVWLTFTIMRS